ncbi:aminoglycoside phosphotransferase family protein [Actinopolymorpha alba]|uniref:aminoglycoside phosphotransferase family protein n=1 Tax=Actinopolymorpha alba TaxID=533267 RepID=UPI000379AE7E|nr:aminoglycoside phosphotransferase family protein [Actinopolymorpha alba]
MRRDPRPRPLADLDPALPRLAGTLAEARPGWTLHDASWRPGERCLLAYRIAPPPSSGQVPTFVAVEVTPDGVVRRDLREDPGLPGVAQAADETVVRDRLAELGVRDVHSCTVEPVRYRPGSRAVLRYDIETGAGALRMYAKVLGGSGRRAAYAVPEALATSAPPGLLPDLLAAWPDRRVLLHRAVEGRQLSAVFGDCGVPSATKLRLAYQLGDLLARLHAAEAAAPIRTPAEALQAVGESLAIVRYADLHLAQRLTRVVDRLAAPIPWDGACVLGHGGFRPGQVILTGRRLTLLDLDSACTCDPERDLATAMAHLTWQGIRRPRDSATFDAAGRAFVAGYERRSGPVDAHALLWWRLLALVRVAVRRYRRLEIADWEYLPRLVEGVERLLSDLPLRAVRGRPLAECLLDRHQMTRILRPSLTPVAADPGALEITAVRPLHQAPGRRTVVGYAVRGLEKGTPVALVGKLFVEPYRATLADANLRALADGPFKDGVLRVPEPLPSPLDQGLVLYRRSGGVPLDQLDGPAEVAGVRAAARWLARLHGSDVLLSRRLDLDAEATNCHAWAGLVADREPDLRLMACRLADRWAGIVKDRWFAARTPIHKDFHAGHVLLGGVVPAPPGLRPAGPTPTTSGVTVVDLDEARMGDPALDVAHFCAYLDLRAGPERAGVLRRVFRKEYAAVADPPDADRAAVFGAYAWLKIAKQLVMGTGPHPVLDDRRRGPKVAHALEMGLRCLDT